MHVFVQANTCFFKKQTTKQTMGFNENTQCPFSQGAPKSCSRPEVEATAIAKVWRGGRGDLGPDLRLHASASELALVNGQTIKSINTLWLTHLFHSPNSSPPPRPHPFHMEPSTFGTRSPGPCKRKMICQDSPTSGSMLIGGRVVWGRK